MPSLRIAPHSGLHCEQSAPRLTSFCASRRHLSASAKPRISKPHRSPCRQRNRALSPIPIACDISLAKAKNGDSLTSTIGASNATTIYRQIGLSCILFVIVRDCSRIVLVKSLPTKYYANTKRDFAALRLAFTPSVRRFPPTFKRRRFRVCRSTIKSCNFIRIIASY